MRVSMLPISVGNLFLQKQKVENKTTTVPNLGLKSDIFIKSSSPNFGNSMTPNEKDLFMSDIKRSIDFNITSWHNYSPFKSDLIVFANLAGVKS